MSAEEFARNMETMRKVGVTAAEAIARMAEGFRQLERTMRSLREWLGLPPYRRPKQVLIVTMDDGMTRRVVRW